MLVQIVNLHLWKAVGTLLQQFLEKTLMNMGTAWGCWLLRKVQSKRLRYRCVYVCTYRVARTCMLHRNIEDANLSGLAEACWPSIKVPLDVFENLDPPQSLTPLFGRNPESPARVPSWKLDRAAIPTVLYFRNGSGTDALHNTAAAHIYIYIYMCIYMCTCTFAASPAKLQQFTRTISSASE